MTKIAFDGAADRLSEIIRGESVGMAHYYVAIDGADDGKIAAFMQLIDDEAELIAQSQKLDAKKWPQKMRMSDLRGHRSLFTYAEELEYLKNWLNIRIKWLNSEWHN